MTDMIDVADIKYEPAREINWGEDFEALVDNSKIVYLKKFSASMNRAAEIIQGERDGLLKDVGVMKKMLESAEQATQAQRLVMITSITNHNLSMQKIGDEMVELKAELREYKSGYNN